MCCFIGLFLVVAAHGNALKGGVMDKKVLSCDTVVIGAGTAGLEAYKAAVASGAHCILVESGPLGTSAKRTGDTPVLALMEAAKKCHALVDLERYGIKTNREFSFDIDNVLNHVRAVRAKDTSDILSFIYQIPELNRLIGKARFVDEHSIVVNESIVVKFRSAVIATGSAPIVPYELSQYGVTGGVYTSNEFFDLDHLPASMAIFGSNREGLLLGQALSYLGVKVVVFGNHRIWELTDDSVIDAAIHAYQQRFELVLDSYTTAIEKYDHGFGIYYLDASNYENVLSVDTILASSVRYPKLDGLNVRSLGLRLDRQGYISVNAQTMQTSIPHIFAAGEVTSLGMTIARARHDGKLAGENAVLYPQPPRSVEPDFNINILLTDPELAQVGLSYDEVKMRAKSGSPFVSSEVRISEGLYRICRNDGGTLRLYCDEATHLILGAEMCMYGASHIAHYLGLAIMQKLTIEQVAATTFFSPAYEEVVQKACAIAIKNLARRGQGLYN